MKKIFKLVIVAVFATIAMHTSAAEPTDEELEAVVTIPDGFTSFQMKNLQLPDKFRGTIIFPESIKTISWDHSVGISVHPSYDDTPPGYENIDNNFGVDFFVAGRGMTVVCKALNPPRNDYFVRPCYKKEYLDYKNGARSYEPPSADMEESPFSTFTLYVPEESIAKYSDESDIRLTYYWAYPNLWAKYGTIRPISEYYASIGITEDDSETPAEYYTLSGIRLSGYPQQNGIYIERRGTSSRKIMVTGF